MKTSPNKLMIRNICLDALSRSPEFRRRGQRVEVTAVDNLTLQVKLYSDAGTMPEYFNVKVSGEK
jgi:hypothetical protein